MEVEAYTNGHLEESWDINSRQMIKFVELFLVYTKRWCVQFVNHQVPALLANIGSVSIHRNIF